MKTIFNFDFWENTRELAFPEQAQISYCVELTVNDTCYYVYEKRLTRSAKPIEYCEIPLLVGNGKLPKRFKSLKGAWQCAYKIEESNINPSVKEKITFDVITLGDFKAKYGL